MIKNKKKESDFNWDILLNKRINLVKEPPEDALYWFHTIKDAIDLGWYKRQFKYMDIYIPTEVNNKWVYSYSKIVVPIDMICSYLWVKETRLKERKKLSEYNICKLYNECVGIQKEIERWKNKIERLEEEKRTILKRESNKARKLLLTSWKLFTWKAKDIMKLGKHLFKDKKEKDKDEEK